MMKDNGGPAFPVQRSSAGGGSSLNGNGMTLRDYFAAKAMSAYISTAGAPCIVGGLDGAEGELSKQAYKVADAMIEARKK